MLPMRLVCYTDSGESSMALPAGCAVRLGPVHPERIVAGRGRGMDWSVAAAGFVAGGAGGQYSKDAVVGDDAEVGDLAARGGDDAANDTSQ